MPRVCIIMAAYGRPHLLRWAIASIQRQTIEDWELIIAGDDCREGTAEAAADHAQRDRRIRFFNLSRNWGDQSGPNNAGIARSHAPYIAFLNQDDLWFPDHLAVLLDWMEASGADVALGASAHFSPMTKPAAHSQWPRTIAGLGRGGRYDPTLTFSPLSAWLVRRSPSKASDRFRRRGNASRNRHRPGFSRHGGRDCTSPPARS